MFGTNKNITAISEYVDESLSEIQDKHNALVDRTKDAFLVLNEEIEELKSSVEDLRESVDDLKTKCKSLDDWDTETRAKFHALSKYLGVQILHRSTEPFEVIELNDDEATEVTTNNQ